MSQPRGSLLLRKVCDKKGTAFGALMVWIVHISVSGSGLSKKKGFSVRE